VAAPVPVQRSTVSAATSGGRSISISLNGTSSKKTAHLPAETKPDIVAENQNESYTPQAFELAWKTYANYITDIVSAANYIRSTLPGSIGGTNYELVFSNVMQENEFKKLMTPLSTYMRQTLRNSGITFSTKVMESAELPRSNNPEEILRKMTEENPALEMLKNNLKLEID
jgi:hypothetical protein